MLPICARNQGDRLHKQQQFPNLPLFHPHTYIYIYIYMHIGKGKTSLASNYDRQTTIHVPAEPTHENNEPIQHLNYSLERDNNMGTDHSLLGDNRVLCKPYLIKLNQKRRILFFFQFLRAKS